MRGLWPRVQLAFKWYDIWVGVYVDKDRRIAYICPLPMVCISVMYCWEKCCRAPHS